MRKSKSYEVRDPMNIWNKVKMPSPSRKKIYPNDICPCGSGMKYKKCCGRDKY